MSRTFTAESPLEALVLEHALALARQAQHRERLLHQVFWRISCTDHPYNLICETCQDSYTSTRQNGWCIKEEILKLFPQSRQNRLQLLNP